MANKQIDDLTNKPVLDGTENVPIQEAAGGAGSTKGATTQAIADLAGASAFPLTTATTLFDDGGGDTVAFDATGAIDSNGGAHFGANPGSGPGLGIASTGQLTLNLTADPAWTIASDAGSAVFAVATTASPVVGIVEVTPRSNTKSLVINGFGGAADAIFYYGPPGFAGEFRVLASGAVLSGAKAAPADADLTNSTFAFWLDDTIGATCLKVKAKDSAGTVRTATIPLT